MRRRTWPSGRSSAIVPSGRATAIASPPGRPDGELRRPELARTAAANGHDRDEAGVRADDDAVRARSPGERVDTVDVRLPVHVAARPVCDVRPSLPAVVRVVRDVLTGERHACPVRRPHRIRGAVGDLLCVTAGRARDPELERRAQVGLGAARGGIDRRVREPVPYWGPDRIPDCVGERCNDDRGVACKASDQQPERRRRRALDVRISPPVRRERRTLRRDSDFERSSTARRDRREPGPVQVDSPIAGEHDPSAPAGRRRSSCRCGEEPEHEAGDPESTHVSERTAALLRRR